MSVHCLRQSPRSALSCDDHACRSWQLCCMSGLHPASQWQCPLVPILY
jgi:hypothetical protein